MASPLVSLNHYLKKVESQRAAKHLYAVFDFDNTCIFNDVAEATIAYQTEHDLLRNKHLLPTSPQKIDHLYHQKVFEKYYGFIDRNEIQEAYEFGAQMLAGYTLLEARNLLEQVLRQEGKRVGKRTLFGRTIELGLRVKPQTKQLLDRVQDYNIDIWVVSASPQVLVDSIFQKFFPQLSYHCIGVETKVHEGVLTDKLIFPTPTFEGKVRCIKKYIDPKTPPILAVGDSVNDLSMLEYAQMPVVVNRANSLATIARERGWHLI